MGEVRVQIRLVNAGDEFLARRKKLSAKKIRSVKVNAVVDTGAIRTCIPHHVMLKLGLLPDSYTEARYADGRTDSVIVTEPVTMEILDRRVTEGLLVLGDEVLLGQTALEATDLLVDCPKQEVVPRNPNTPVLWVR